MHENPTEPIHIPNQKELAAATNSGKRTFRLIQVLRGIAALMVVWLHTTKGQFEQLHLNQTGWGPGGAGVDLFFVISGFVMAMSSQSLHRAAHPLRTFMARRLERIVPLYWLATTTKLLLLKFFPGASNKASFGVWHVMASYLFVPTANAAGLMPPVLPVGWTLNFEMFFYVIFSIGLGLRLSALPYLSVVLVSLGALGMMNHVHLPALFTLADPLLFEFLYGIILFRFVSVLDARKNWQKVFCVALTLVAFAIIVNHPDELDKLSRPFWWGVPAMLIVGSALALEKSIGRLIPRGILEVGDASYSIYLTHALTLPAIWYVLNHHPMGASLGVGFQAWMILVVCLLISLGVYRAVELPIIRFFQDKRRRAVPAAVG